MTEEEIKKDVAKTVWALYQKHIEDSGYLVYLLFMTAGKLVEESMGMEVLPIMFTELIENLENLTNHKTTSK